MRIRLALGGMILGIWLLAGCEAPKTAPNGKPVVVPTTSLIHDALRHIAGDAVDLRAPLCGAGTDPHSYEATAADIKLLSSADLVLYNGLGLESHLETALQQLGEKAMPVTYKLLPAGKLLPWTEAAHEDGHHHHSQYDPHVWTDPTTWTLCIRTMAEVLAMKFPPNAALFRANADAYIAEINAAYEAGQAAVARLPQARRILVTNHETFHYFARAYQFEVRGLMGISSESEAGIRDLQELAAYLVAHKVPTIFVESALGQREMLALQEAVKSLGGTVAISATPLYADALASTPPANTYPGMMQANLNTILAGLGVK